MKSKTKNTIKSLKILPVLAALLITPTLLGITDSNQSPETEQIAVAPFKWQECLIASARERGKSEREIGQLLQAVSHGSVRNDGDFLSLIVAIMAVESQYNAQALSPSGAVGLMQVMPIGAIEAERQCPKLVSMGNKYGKHHAVKLLDPTNNVRYGSCLLSHYMKQVNDNVLLALIMYNGGYKQLTRITDSATVTTETREYVFRVHQQLRKCQQ